MYCPKCGSESQENQRFCKACGVNLQIVNEALGSGEDTLGKLRIDVDTIMKDVVDFTKGIKPAWNKMTEQNRSHRDTHPIENKDEKHDREFTMPKDYLSYSWQHNLRNGLLSLFGGAGLGIVLYLLSDTAIAEGLIRSAEEIARRPLTGLEQVLRLIWIVALIPVLKGIAQIIYAAFFAESIKTLTERIAPRPLIAPEPVRTSFTGMNEPPSSVTENTTQFFGEEAGGKMRESQ